MANEGPATMQEVARNLVLQLCMIINPAPLVPEDQLGEVENHRGNTPWYIHFPSQNVTVMVTDGDGNPKTGYFPEREAENQAIGLWTAMRENQELRFELQANSMWPTLEPGYKIMYRDLRVAPMPE
jgi:hypothetical protein